LSFKCSQEEKVRRWEEIRMRQHRLRAMGHGQVKHVNLQSQAYMKSGFTMGEIDGCFSFFARFIFILSGSSCHNYFR